jgi:hypothetical protein
MITTQEFFDSLTAEPHPLLTHTKGTLHFEVLDGAEEVECWHVAIDHGTVLVTRDHADADAVIQLEKPLFDAITTGRANAMAATLRGELGLEGSLELLTVFQRLFPGPPDNARPKDRESA